MFRTVISRNARLFSTSAVARKSAVDPIKDTLKAVDRKVSDAAVKGIEKGEEVAHKVKSTTGQKASEAQGKASELSGEAQGKASELTGEASGKAAELKGEAKGKAHEVAGKAQGTAEQAKSKI